MLPTPYRYHNTPHKFLALLIFVEVLCGHCKKLITTGVLPLILYMLKKFSHDSIRKGSCCPGTQPCHSAQPLKWKEKEERIGRIRQKDLLRRGVVRALAV